MRIELVSTRIAEGPARSPSAEQIDDRLQLASGPGQPVLGALAARGAAPLQHSRPLQPPQPLGEQRAGHVGKTALELVEVVNVGEGLADDQQRPAISEDLCCSRNRTILPVGVHDRA